VLEPAQVLVQVLGLGQRRVCCSLQSQFSKMLG
jgi:hypothetical protein